MTCPGNFILYLYGITDCVGTSCPSEPLEYEISDMYSLITGSEVCDFEFLEADEGTTEQFGGERRR